MLSNSTALRQRLSTVSPDIQAAQARVDQAEAVVRGSRLYPNPTLSLQMGSLAIGHRNPRSLSILDTPSIGIGIAETVQIGKREPRIRAARLARDSEVASAQATLAMRVGNAREALARLIWLQERERLLQERLVASREVLGMEKIRLEHGDISGIDHDRLVVDTTAIERAVADNRVEAELVAASCEALLLGPCLVDGNIAVVDGAAPVPTTLEAQASRVLERAELRALRLSVSAAEATAEAARRQAIPDPTLGLTYTHDYLTFAGNQPNTITLWASLPLPLSNRGQHDAALAQAQGRELGYHARAIEKESLAMVRALASQQRVLHSKLDTLSRVALPSSTRAIEASQSAYQRGQISMTDLLLVRREHFSVLLDELDTRFDLFSVRNALRRTLGLDEEYSKKAP